MKGKNRMAILLVWILISTLWIPKATSYQLDSDAKNFAENLQDFLDKSLKHNEMQAHLDKLSFKQERLDGKAMLDSLTEKFAKNFAKRITSVKRLRDAVQKSYSDISLGYSRCCDFSDTVHYDPRFKVSVSYDKACDFISVNAPYYSFRLDDAFKRASIRNLKETPSMLWQYFGSEEGVTSVYPAMPACTCGKYDCLSRPWYTQVTERKPKQVVIIVDSGESMAASYWGSKPMAMATEAARLLIEALNPYDEFIVLLSTEETLIDSVSKVTGNKCFLSKFSFATPANKKDAFRVLESATPLGDTSYFRSLDEAFHFLQTSYQKGDKKNYEDVERIIHLISDGISYDAQYLLMEEIYNWNRDLNNSVKILTYGIGNGDMKILSDIANFNPDRFKNEDVIRMNEISKLKEHIATSHRHFAANERSLSEPKWILPYFDKWGLGHMLTVSLPVYIKKELIGVVAIDSQLEELFTKSTSFKPNELSYSFVINDEGLALNHPLLQYTEENQMTFVPITTFERDPEFLKVLESMLKGEAGRGSFISTNYQSIGNSKKYGVKSVHLVSTYYWRRIPNTPFSVCVVCIGETQRVPMPQAALPRGSVLYNRFDLVRPTKPCRHFHSYASMDKSTVFLASHAFSEPDHYFDHEFTRSDIESIVSYLEGDGPNVHKIKEEVRDEVAVSNRIQNFWSSADNSSVVKNNVLWRYLATRNGLFRILPAIQIAEEFDATARPWFEHTLARRNKGTTISPPYKDFVSGIPVVTIGQVLYKGSWTRIHFPGTDEIFGVMGVDLQVSYFTNLFLQWFPSCQYSDLYRCYLIDKAGYILTGNNMNERKWGNAKHRIDYDEHIIEFEPEIGSVLIRDDVLQKTNCSNVETGMFYQTYSIPDSQAMYWGSFHANADESFDFELIPIPGTNTFVILRILTEFETSAAVLVCPCTEEVCAISSRDRGSCECPCSNVNTYYDSCRNKYSTSSNTPPPCIPPKKILEPDTRISADLSSLPKCYNTSFVTLEPIAKSRLNASQLVIVFAAGMSLGLCLLYCRRRRKAAAKSQERKSKKKNKLGKGLVKQSQSDQTFKIRFGLSFSAKRNREYLRKTKSDSRFSPGGNEQLSAETLEKLLKKLPPDQHHQQTEKTMKFRSWTSPGSPHNFLRKLQQGLTDFQANMATFAYPTHVRKSKSDEEVYKPENQFFLRAGLDLSSQHHNYQGLYLQMQNYLSTEMLRNFLSQRKTDDGFPTQPPQEFLKRLRQVKTDSDIPNKFEIGSIPSVKELKENFEKMGRKQWRLPIKRKQAPTTDWQRITKLPTYSNYQNQDKLETQQKKTAVSTAGMPQRNIKTPSHFAKSLLKPKLPNEQSQRTLLKKEQNTSGMLRSANNSGVLLERSDWKLLNPGRHGNSSANIAIPRNMTVSKNKLSINFHEKCLEPQEAYREIPKINQEKAKEIRKTISESSQKLLKKIDQSKQMQHGRADTGKVLSRKIKTTKTDPQISQTSDKDVGNSLRKIKTEPRFTSDRHHAMTSHQLAMDILKKKVETKKKEQTSADNNLGELLNKLKQEKNDSQSVVTDSVKSLKKTNADSNNSRHRNLARSGQLAKELLGKLKELNEKKDGEITKERHFASKEQNLNSNIVRLKTNDILPPKPVKTDQVLYSQHHEKDSKQLKKTRTLPQMSSPRNDDFSKELIQIFNKKETTEEKKAAGEKKSNCQSQLNSTPNPNSSDEGTKSIKNITSEMQTESKNSISSKPTTRLPKLPSNLLKEIQQHHKRRDEEVIEIFNEKKEAAADEKNSTFQSQLNPPALPNSSDEDTKSIENITSELQTKSSIHSEPTTRFPKLPSSILKEIQKYHKRNDKELLQVFNKKKAAADEKNSTFQSLLNPQPISHSSDESTKSVQTIISEMQTKSKGSIHSETQLRFPKLPSNLLQEIKQHYERNDNTISRSQTNVSSQDTQTSAQQIKKSEVSKEHYSNFGSQLLFNELTKDVYQSPISQQPDEKTAKDLYQSSSSELSNVLSNGSLPNTGTNQVLEARSFKHLYHSATAQFPEERINKNLYHSATSQLREDSSSKDLYQSATSQLTEDSSSKDLYQSATNQFPKKRSSQDLYQSATSQLPKDRSSQDLYQSATSQLREDKSSEDLYQSATSQLREDKSSENLYQNATNQFVQNSSRKDLYHSAAIQLPEDSSSQDLYRSATNQFVENRSRKDLYQSATIQLPEDSSSKDLYQSATNQFVQNRPRKDLYHSDTSQFQEERSSQDLYRSGSYQFPKNRSSKDVYQSATSQLLEQPPTDLYHSAPSQLQEQPFADLYHSAPSQLLEQPSVELYHSAPSQLQEQPSADLYHSAPNQLSERRLSEGIYHSPINYLPANATTEMLNKTSRTRSLVDKFYKDLYRNTSSQLTKNLASKELLQSSTSGLPKNSVFNNFSTNSVSRSQVKKDSKQLYNTSKDKVSSNTHSSKSIEVSENSNSSGTVNQPEKNSIDQLPSTTSSFKQFNKMHLKRFQSDAPFQKVGRNSVEKLQSVFLQKSSQTKSEPARYGPRNNLPQMPMDLLQQIRQIRESKIVSPEVVYTSSTNKIDSDSATQLPVGLSPSLSVAPDQIRNQRKVSHKSVESAFFENKNKKPIAGHHAMLISNESSTPSSSNQASISSIHDKLSADKVSSIPDTANMTHLLMKQPRTLAKKIIDGNHSNLTKQPDNLIKELSTKLANLNSGNSIPDKNDNVLTAVQMNPHLNLTTQSDKGPLGHSKKSFVTQSSLVLYTNETPTIESTTQTDESFVNPFNEMSISQLNLRDSTPSDQSFETALSALSNESYTTASSDTNVQDKLYYYQTEDMLSVHHYQIKSYHSVDTVDLQQDEQLSTQIHRKPTLAQALKYTGKLDQRFSPPKDIQAVDVSLTPKNNTFFTQTQSVETLSNVTSMKSRSGLGNQVSSASQLSPTDKVPSFTEQLKSSYISSASPLTSQRLLHISTKPDGSNSRQILEFDSKSNGKIHEEISREEFKISSKETKNEIAVVMQNSLFAFEEDQSKPSLCKPSLYEFDTGSDAPFSSQRDNKDTFVMSDAQTPLESEISSLGASSHVSTDELQQKVPFQSLSTVSDYFVPMPYEKYATLSPSDQGPITRESNSTVGATTVKKLVSPIQSQETFLENIHLQGALRKSMLSPRKDASSFSNFSQNSFVQNDLSRQETARAINSSLNRSLDQNGSSRYNAKPVSTSSNKLLKEDVLNQMRRKSIHEELSEKEKVTQYVRECVNDAVERAMVHIGKFKISSSTQSNNSGQNNALSGKTYRSVQFKPFSSTQAVRGSFANVQDLLSAEDSEQLSNWNDRSAPNMLETFMPSHISQLQFNQLKETEKENASYLHPTTLATLDDTESIKNLDGSSSLQHSHMPNIRVEVDVTDNNQASSTEIYYSDPASHINSFTEALALTSLKSLHRKSNYTASPLSQAEIQNSIDFLDAAEELDPPNTPEIYATPVASLESITSEAQFNDVYESVDEFERATKIQSASETASHKDTRSEKPSSARKTGVKSENALAKNRTDYRWQAETASIPLLQKQTDIRRKDVFFEKGNVHSTQVEKLSMPRLHPNVNSQNLSTSKEIGHLRQKETAAKYQLHKQAGVKSEKLFIKKGYSLQTQPKTMSMPHMLQQPNVKSQNAFANKQSGHTMQTGARPKPHVQHQAVVKSEDVLAKRGYGYQMQTEAMSMPHLYKQSKERIQNAFASQQSSHPNQTDTKLISLQQKQASVKNANVLIKKKSDHPTQDATVTTPHLYKQPDVRSLNVVVDQQIDHTIQVEKALMLQHQKQAGTKSENILAQRRNSHLTQAETVSMPGLYKQPNVRTQSVLANKQSSDPMHTGAVPKQLLQNQTGTKNENLLAQRRKSQLTQAEAVSMPGLYKHPNVRSQSVLANKQSNDPMQRETVPTQLLHNQTGAKSENVFAQRRNSHLSQAETVSMPGLYRQTNVISQSVLPNKQSDHPMQTQLLRKQAGAKSENVFAQRRNSQQTQAETVSMPGLYKQPNARTQSVLANKQSSDPMQTETMPTQLLQNQTGAKSENVFAQRRNSHLTQAETVSMPGLYEQPNARTQSMLANKQSSDPMQTETVPTQLLQNQTGAKSENVFAQRRNSHLTQAQTVSMPGLYKQTNVRTHSVLENTLSSDPIQTETVPTQLLQNQTGTKSENVFAQRRNSHLTQAETVSMPGLYEQPNARTQSMLANKQSSDPMQTETVPTQLLQNQTGAKSENVFAQRRNSHLTQAQTVSMPGLYKQPIVRTHSVLENTLSSVPIQTETVPTQLLQNQTGAKSENVFAQRRNSHLTQAETVSMPGLYKQPNARTQSMLANKQSSDPIQTETVPTQLLQNQARAKSENVFAQRRNSHLTQAEAVSMPGLYKQPNVRTQSVLANKQSSDPIQTETVPTQLLQKQAGAKSENVLAQRQNSNLAQAQTVSMPGLYKQANIRTQSVLANTQSSDPIQTETVPTQLLQKQAGAKSENVIAQRRNSNLAQAQTVSMPGLYKQTNVRTQSVLANTQSSDPIQTETVPTQLLQKQAGAKSENVFTQRRNSNLAQAQTVSMPGLYNQSEFVEGRNNPHPFVLRGFASSQESGASIKSYNAQDVTLEESLSPQNEDQSFSGFTLSDPSFSNVNYDYPKTVYSGLTIDGSPMQSDDFLTRKHQQKFNSFSQAYSSITNPSYASYSDFQVPQLTIQSEMYLPTPQTHQKVYSRSEMCFPTQQESQLFMQDYHDANVTNIITSSEEEEDDWGKFEHEISLQKETSPEAQQVQISPEELIEQDVSNLIEQVKEHSKESTSGPAGHTDSRTHLKSVKSVRFSEKDVSPQVLSEPGLKSNKQVDEKIAKPKKQNISKSSKDFTNLSRPQHNEIDPCLSFQYASSELYLNIFDEANPKKTENLSSTNRSDNSTHVNPSFVGSSRGELVDEQKIKEPLPTEMETQNTNTDEPARGTEEEHFAEYAKRLKKIMLDQPFDQVKLRHVE